MAYPAVSGDDSKLTSKQTEVLITIERTGAGLSMVAVTLTVLSYLLFKKLRTTPNLFLVFVSIANAGASVASMIGLNGLQMGENSLLCQTQGFIFEWYVGLAQNRRRTKLIMQCKPSLQVYAV